MPALSDNIEKDLHNTAGLKQGYKDSNLEMTESESGALPFGDTPLSVGSVSRLRYYIILQNKKQVFFLFFLQLQKLTHYLRCSEPAD